MKERNEYITYILTFGGFVWFSLWLYFFATFDTFAYDNVKVETMNCRITYLTNDPTGCRVTNIKEGIIWYVQPCIYGNNRTSRKEICVDNGRTNLPIPPSYYVEDESVTEYKLTNFYIVIIVPIILSVCFICNIRSELIEVWRHIRRSSNEYEDL